MIMNFFNYFSVNYKSLLRDSIILIMLLVCGYFLASTFRMDISTIETDLNPLNIFLNNAKIAILSILGTVFLAYFIFFINGIFLGMNIYASLQIYSISKVLNYLLFHGPLELICWILTLQISIKCTKYVLVSKDIYPTKRLIILTFTCYFIAALIESFIAM